MPEVTDAEVRLILARGLPAQAAHWLADSQLAPDPAPTGRAARRLCGELVQRGLLRPGVEVQWPDARVTAATADRLRRAQVRLAWRGGPGYPSRLERQLQQAAPAWVWLAGDDSRFALPACSVIGSRQSPPRFLEAARVLARVLAEAGIAIVSGMAAGADSAAHEGARQGRAGTIAIPARGILAAGLSGPACARQSATALALGRPDEPFSAGLAIRRNDLIAALGQGLVLVAGGLKGGSSHAIRWALARRRPLWCFEAGRQTPPANAHLLRQGLAAPLPLSAGPQSWCASILPALADPPDEATFSQPDMLSLN